MKKITRKISLKNPHLGIIILLGALAVWVGIYVALFTFVLDINEKPSVVKAVLVLMVLPIVLLVISIRVLTRVMPIVSLEFHPPKMILLRRGKKIAEIDLSRPHGLVIVKGETPFYGVLVNQPKRLWVEIFLWQNGTEISFSIPWIPVHSSDEENEKEFAEIKSRVLNLRSRISLEGTSSPKRRPMLSRTKYTSWSANNPQQEANLRNYIDWLEIMDSYYQNNTALARMEETLAEGGTVDKIIHKLRGKG